jgi:N-acetylmuramoyl-L-alanine amidase
VACWLAFGLWPGFHLAHAALPAEAPANGSQRRPVLSAYDRAERDREQFELRGEARTKNEFVRVLDEFRAVYHDNPHDTHAAAAIYAVAELLVEQGRQFDDSKSLRAALGQYEFLRTQYPGSPLRTAALLAEGRIARQDLGDETLAEEKFRALLKEAPASAAGKAARAELAATESGAPANPLQRAALPHEAAAAPDKPSAPGARAPVRPSAVEMAAVTGIRHWSTATYTRVAIDLGDNVTFEAARVPHPDRLFFDLHGARLAQELAGKSFDVTDNGFLKRIRAAQASPDVTRVVLDVSDVSEYSAFLLPNPYRLIIDIHGAKVAGPSGQPAVSASAVVDDAPDLPETPIAAGASKAATAAADHSGLPAMPVTAGVATTAAAPQPPTQTPTHPQTHPQTHVQILTQAQAQAEPGAANATAPGHPAPAPGTSSGQTVGALAKVTLGRPVPNTVAVKAPATQTEVAAVGAAPGRIDATSTPTSRPIAATVRPAPGKTLPANSPAAAARATPAKAAARTADGETSLVRALGLKIGRIVIDAGHGGHDSGTLGVDGIEEKDIVLDVALRLGRLLHDRLGAEIVYTRSDDTFIPLETRTAIANKAQADLFLSIHANSSPDAAARGVETYYLNFTSDPTALDVAARENALSDQSIHQLGDLVKKIALKDKIEESREFAADVEGSLYAGLARGNAGLKDRGVKKAPFVVLIGANMPSILAEISFVTNQRDATELREPEYRQRVAESLYAGVAKYENSLAGARPAMPITRASVGEH